jgi:hypothetical protein
VYLLRERASEMRGYTCAARFRQGSGETQLSNCVVITDAELAGEVARKAQSKVCLYKDLWPVAAGKLFQMSGSPE